MKGGVAIMFDVAGRIDDLCHSRGWSYYELSKRTGILTNTLYQWKKRKYYPTIINIEKVCDAFDITLRQFFLGNIKEDLNDDQTRLLEGYDILTDKEKLLIQVIIDCLNDSRE